MLWDIQERDGAGSVLGGSIAMKVAGGGDATQDTVACVGAGEGGGAEERSDEENSGSSDFYTQLLGGVTKTYHNNSHGRDSTDEAGGDGKVDRLSGSGCCYDRTDRDAPSRDRR